jgi:hypothetical protein
MCLMLDTQVTRKLLQLSRANIIGQYEKKIVTFISIFLACQKVKDEHRHPAGLLYPFPIPEWKWEVVTMDFITKLPRTTSNMIISWWWWTSLPKLPILF